MNDQLLKIVQGRNKRELHAADWIVVDSSTIIKNGYLETENDIITGIHKGTPKEKYIHHGSGVLLPPLVNTHLHLELSALYKRLPFDMGFQTWVKKLLEEREALGRENLITSAQHAIRDLARTGNLYIGDISTLGIMEPLLKKSSLKGISFHEFLGSDIPCVQTRKEETLSLSIAGHAPHSSSPQLLKTLKQKSRSAGLPFSIHVAESDEEIQFFREQKGGWADFLTSRGIDWSSWKISSKTPVSHINDLGLLDSSTLAVHLLQVTNNDIQILSRSKAKVCLCPRSNHYLHGKLPPIEKMLEAGIEPALGTDSLASCPSLNIFDEMAFVRKQYSGLSPQIIFSMGTENGARALGIEAWTGSLSKGKRADFLYRPVKATNETDLLQRIISNE